MSDNIVCPFGIGQHPGRGARCLARVSRRGASPDEDLGIDRWRIIPPTPPGCRTIRPTTQGVRPPGEKTMILPGLRPCGMCRQDCTATGIITFLQENSNASPLGSIGQVGRPYTPEGRGKHTNKRSSPCCEGIIERTLCRHLPAQGPHISEEIIPIYLRDHQVSKAKSIHRFGSATEVTRMPPSALSVICTAPFLPRLVK